MPVAHCVKATSAHSEDRMEVQFDDIEPTGVQYELTFGEVGKETNSSGPDDFGWACAYDVSQIPLAHTVVRAKWIYTAAVTSVPDFNAQIYYHDGGAAIPSEATQSSYVEAITREHKTRSTLLDTASQVVSLEGSTTNANIVVAFGQGCKGLGQSMFCNPAGTGLIGFATFWLAYSGALNTGTMWCELWSNVGGGGRRSRGVLLGTSDTRPASDNDNTSAVPYTFTFPTPVDFDLNDRLLLTINWSDDPGLVGGKVYGAMDTAFSSPNQNSFCFGEGMDGFCESAWPSGTEIQLGKGRLLGGEEIAMPVFTQGVQGSFGDATYGVDTVLNDFTSYIADALSQRTTPQDRLVLQWITGSGAVSGEKRRWRTAYNGISQEVDGQDFFGTVLQIDYTVPGLARSSGPRARPAVAASESRARSAVLLTAEPRARATTMTAEDFRARAPVNALETRARPTVRAFPAISRST